MIESDQTLIKEEATLMYESNQQIIKHKLGLLNLAEELRNVSKACKVMGLSRDTSYCSDVMDAPPIDGVTMRQN